MADYTPVFLPGDAITLTASATTVGGDLMEVSATGTVAPFTRTASVGSLKFVGVAGNDAAANAKVTVYARGPVHESVAVGTITAGDLLTTAQTGDTAGAQVKTLAAVTTPTAGDVSNTRAMIGVALTTASNPNKVRWMQL
jgi:Uncharacterized conserved protein (DUF2190)